MNKKELIKLATYNNDAIETYPFKDKVNSQHAVIRHKSNNKWFALIFYLDDKLCINLKCNPIDSAILRDTYDFIKPAWHMNKAHWITIEVNKSPKDLLQNLINKSFEITAQKSKKKVLHNIQDEDF